MGNLPVSVCSQSAPLLSWSVILSVAALKSFVSSWFQVSAEGWTKPTLGRLGGLESLMKLSEGTLIALGTELGLDSLDGGPFILWYCMDKIIVLESEATLLSTVDTLGGAVTGCSVGLDVVRLEARADLLGGMMIGLISKNGIECCCWWWIVKSQNNDIDNAATFWTQQV